MQEFLVGLIVVYAVWSLLVRYTPKAMRRRVRNLAARALDGMGMQGLAGRIGSKDDTDCSSGCGSCGGCGPAPRTDTNANKSEQSSITPDALRRTARTAAGQK
ncbi:MAG TPA: DUF6587 family protein [Noviherbaspirillum sp.]|nr:DUF6587 family protein [Noviherbaspirillum sp.]